MSLEEMQILFHGDPRFWQVMRAMEKAERAPAPVAPKVKRPLAAPRAAVPASTKTRMAELLRKAKRPTG